MAAALGITGTSQAPIDYGPPTIGITSFGSLSDGIYSLTRPQTLSFTDNVTYVYKRKHNFTFGYSYRVADNPNNNEQSARGQFSFNGSATAQFLNGTAVRNTGYNFTRIRPAGPALYQHAPTGHQHLPAELGDIRVRAGRLSCLPRNHGEPGLALRVFRAGHGEIRETGEPGLEFGLDPSGNRDPEGIPCTGLDVAAAGPKRVAFQRQSACWPGAIEKTMFSPRIRIAWKPSQKHSTNLRAGYSIFYSGGAYGTIANNMLGQPPFTENVINTATPATPLTLENGFPRRANALTTNTWAINPNQKRPTRRTGPSPLHKRCRTMC